MSEQHKSQAPRAKLATGRERDPASPVAREGAQPLPTSAIAVIGISSLFPGSKDVDGFWRDIVDGKDRLGPVPRTHWLVEDYYDPDPKAPDKIYVDRGGFIDPVPFDPMKWGVPPATLPSTDTTQLLSLLVAERALHDAFGAKWESIDRDRVGVMLGVTSAQKLLGEMNSRLQRPVWARALREMGLSAAEVEDACDRISASYVPWQETTFPGVLGNVVAGRIANRLDLGGTNCVTDAACASAFGALHMAVNELLLGHADVTICGGADTMNDPFMFECFAKTTALSKKGDCTPFDARADGTMLGEGIAMLVLCRLEDAERRGDRVYAVIRGVGTSSDGRAKSVYAPLPSGQAKALRRAYERAGYGPETVELVEAHGTGTAAGDAAEVAALLEVFGARTERSCALGSVKAQIGHTKAAAGAAGLIKAVLALRHGVIPPTIKVEQPADALKDGPFYLPARARPWIRGTEHPRRASVSSFGFGGSNYHLTLEEYAGENRALRLPVDGAELVVLSAKDAPSLASAMRAIEGPLRFVAWSSQRAFDPSMTARLAIVADSDEDLRGKLELAASAVERGESFSAPGGIEVAFGAGGDPVAMLFPGQGSQYVEMGAALAMRFEAARAVWDRAGDLHRVVFPPHTFDANEREEQGKQLTRTQNAQPALGAASLAMLAVLRSLGIGARAYGGHSFGEVSALYAAGAFGERELFAIANKRGELMSSGEGAMLAVSAPIDQVRAIAGDLSIANHNHPTQVVLSGSVAAIEAAEARCKERRLRASRLEVSAAFHSPLVAGSKAPFEAFLATIEVGSLSAPVYANATARPYEDDVRATLAAQIAEPVRFVEQIEAMYAAGIRTFVEVGAGSVLSGLVERILSGKPHRAVAMDRKGSAGLKGFYAGLARLAAAGVPIAFDALWDGERAPIDPESIVRPKMTVDVNGANLGKPYPGDPERTPPPPTFVRESLAPVGAGPRSALPASAPDDAALRAFLETQKQTAEAHIAYQRAVADAHSAFLRSSEAAMTAIAALAGGAPITLPTLAASLPTFAASLPT
jgi:polyketide-type polyunsaturated fatty acid synthase PfaA